jgi:plasmid stability protein
MAQLLVRDLDPETVNQLKALAEKHKRSLEAQVRLILEEAAARQAREEEFWRFAAEVRERSGPQTSDSVDLIREDRER